MQVFYKHDWVSQLFFLGLSKSPSFVGYFWLLSGLFAVYVLSFVTHRLMLIMPATRIHPEFLDERMPQRFKSLKSLNESRAQYTAS
jgi:hypothetical protein